MPSKPRNTQKSKVMSPSSMAVSQYEMLMTPTLKVQLLPSQMPLKPQRTNLPLTTPLVSPAHGIRALASSHSLAPPPKLTTKVLCRPLLTPTPITPIPCSVCAPSPGPSMTVRPIQLASHPKSMSVGLTIPRKQSMRQLHSMPDRPFQPQQVKQTSWPMTQIRKAMLSIFTHFA